MGRGTENSDAEVVGRPHFATIVDKQRVGQEGLLREPRFPKPGHLDSLHPRAGCVVLPRGLEVSMPDAYEPGKSYQFSVPTIAR